MSPAPKRRQLPGSPFNVPHVDEPVEVFQPDDRVSHGKYGLGRVINVEGDTALTVQCGEMRVRVTSPFSSLDKL